MAAPKATPTHDALGRAVRIVRARRGWSQEGLGYRARLHRNYVGQIERGEINPTFSVLRRLCRGLRIPPSRLMAESEKLEREQAED